MNNRAVAATVYVVAICAANYLVYWIGPWWSVANSFLLIGLDFVIRDYLHEKIGGWRVALLALAAGALSYALNPAGGMIALASCMSFVMAALADGFTYQKLINRRWVVKSNASNCVASCVDSIVFPLVAFGAFMPGIIFGQVLAKIIGGAFWSLSLRVKA